MIHIFNSCKTQLTATDKNPSLQTLIRVTVTLALLLMLTPIAAQAADVNTYATLQTEAAKTSGDNLIRLTADITDGATQLTIGRSLILDLNGKSQKNSERRREEMNDPSPTLSTGEGAGTPLLGQGSNLAPSISTGSTCQDNRREATASHRQGIFHSKSGVGKLT